MTATATGVVRLDEEESKECVGDVVKAVVPSNNPVVRTNDIAVAVAVDVDVDVDVDIAADADAGKTRGRLQGAQLLLRLRNLAILMSHSKEKVL